MTFSSSQSTKQSGAGTPNPPGPPVSNALRSLRSFQRQPLDFLSQLERAYGGVVRFSTGLLPVYLVTSPSGVRQILQTNYRNYSKQTFTYAMAKALSGENLLTSEGANWLRRRRMLQPLFHRKVLEGFAGVMVEVAQSRLQQWLSNDQPIDLVAEMMAVTLDVAGRTLFSSDLSDATPAIRQALNTSAGEVLRQFQSPLAVIWTLVGFPPPRSQAWQQANRYLDELIFGLMEERRKREEMSPDMLSLLLQTVDEETGEPLSAQEIRDEIGIFLTAGHETTALGLTWAWLCLAQNPETEARLHAEVDRVLAGRTPTVADLTQLPYTQAVFEEALRLYPPVWGFSRRAMDDDTIDGYRIPAGARMMLSPYVTQRSQRYWEEPALFRPERFLTDDTYQPDAYFLFGAGPRQCIGNRFALMEGTLILATIAQQLRLARLDSKPIAAMPLATLRPDRPIYVQAYRRYHSY